MGKNQFREALINHIGSDVEINTDTIVIDGLLEDIKGNIVTVIEVIDYGTKIVRYCSLDAIKFVRVL